MAGRRWKGGGGEGHRKWPAHFGNRPPSPPYTPTKLQLGPVLSFKVSMERPFKVCCSLVGVQRGQGGVFPKGADHAMDALDTPPSRPTLCHGFRVRYLSIQKYPAGEIHFVKKKEGGGRGGNHHGRSPSGKLRNHPHKCCLCCS